MTTGSRGLHVVVPLDRSANFDVVRAFAADAADLLAMRYPDDLTTATRKKRRGRRLFLDVARNAYAQTAVPPYAVRTRAGATVATPIAWDELESVGPRDYTIRNIFRRLAQTADPWAGMMRHARALGKAGIRLDALRDRMKDQEAA
jgi:bifunctional non-homologous end joining protein LigD